MQIFLTQYNLNYLGNPIGEFPWFAYKNAKLSYCLWSKDAFATCFSNFLVSLFCLFLCSINARISSGVFRFLSCQFVIILLKYSNVGFDLNTLLFKAISIIFKS